MKRSNKIRRFSTLNHKLHYKRTFIAQFIYAQAATVYSLPETDHSLIQGESYNGSLRQRKYINTAIRNTTDSISDLDNIANPFTAENAYPDANLCCTLFIFIDDTGSTSYVLGTGSNRIILNYVRQFKLFHPCKVNVKGIVGSNFQSGEPVQPTYPSSPLMEQFIT